MKAKKAIVLSMAALAAQAAMRDIHAEMHFNTISMSGMDEANARAIQEVVEDNFDLNYDWDPSDGMCA